MVSNAGYYFVAVCHTLMTLARLSYYQVFAKSDTTLEMMAQIAQARWRIEECFKLAKDQLGLGEYEVCSGARLASTYHPRPGRSNISHRITTPNPAAIHQATPPLTTTILGSLAAFKAARGLLSD